MLAPDGSTANPYSPLSDKRVGMRGDVWVEDTFSTDYTPPSTPFPLSLSFSPSEKVINRGRTPGHISPGAETLEVWCAESAKPTATGRTYGHCVEIVRRPQVQACTPVRKQHSRCGTEFRLAIRFGVCDRSGRHCHPGRYAGFSTRWPLLAARAHASHPRVE